MTTIATLFSGFDLVGVGARAAGLTHLWGIEYDDQIAQVARDNGFNTITADVMTVDLATLPIPDVLHASPVCKRASVANQGAKLNEDGTKEAPEDIEAGRKVAQFIDVMQPQIFTLENVYAYRNFQAFKVICAALDQGGYWWDFDNLNAADYGVPQTRRRLILRARRGALLPMLPQPERWVGWYEAIEDLIPTLPESRFAEWQLKRLPEEIKESILSQSKDNNEWGKMYRSKNEPSITVTSSHENRIKAFILDCQNGTQEGGVTLRQGNAPMFTVTSGKAGRQPVRAWLVDDQRTTDDSPTRRNSNEPSFPILAGSNHPVRAFLIPGDNASNDTIRYGDEPTVTVGNTNRVGNIPRAWLSQGRVVSMTPRALARFQSIPDDYILPDNKKLACTGIGNGYPCLMAQKIIAPLVENL